jgi:hypothetical protein
VYCGCKKGEKEKRRKIKKKEKGKKENKKCMFVFISGIFLQRDGKA